MDRVLASGARDSGSSPLGGAALLLRWFLVLALVAADCAQRVEDAAPTPVIKTALVRIPAFRFEPAQLEIGRGTVVTWQNDDDARHVIANSRTPAIPLNPDRTYDLRGSMFQFTLDAGGGASFTFNEAGTYYYFCLVHNVMRGVVVVR